MDNRKKLEELLDGIKQNPERGLGEEFPALLEQTALMVPAVLPTDLTPEVVKQLQEGSDQNQMLPDGVNPSPCLLENAEGEKFLPLFTSQEQIQIGGEGAPNFDITISIPFLDCVNMLKENQMITGIVLNPYEHNLVIPVNVERPLQDNGELERMLDEVKQNPGNGFGEGFSELLEQTIFMVPAILPPETDPEIIKQMYAEPGKNKTLPEGANPRPCLLENADGDKFLPLFTSHEQVQGGGENTPKFDLTINVPFQDCIDMVKENTFVKGAVINPYVHNIVVPVNMMRQVQTQEKRQRITLDEYHVLLRQSFESHSLPKHLFEEKGECALKISKEKGAYLKELFEEVYSEEYACPYTEDEFDCLSMQISEDLLVVQIMMPKKFGNRNTASSIVYGWDKKQKKIWYYALVQGQGSKKGVLVEKFADGTMEQHGEAEENGLLYALVQKIQEKKD